MWVLGAAAERAPWSVRVEVFTLIAEMILCPSAGGDYRVFVRGWPDPGCDAFARLFFALPSECRDSSPGRYPRLRQLHQMAPRETVIVSPLMPLAPSSQRNAMVSATSWTVTMRFAG